MNTHTRERTRPLLFETPPGAPQPALVHPSRTVSTLVPDAAVTIALPESRMERGAVQATRPMPARMLLFDVKGIHGGTSWYQCPRARDEQAGAVAQRAHSVALEYRRHAQAVDAGSAPPDPKVKSAATTATGLGLHWHP